MQRVPKFPATLADFRSTIMRMVKTVGQMTFTTPEDDWVMMLFIQNESGLVLTPIDTPLLNTNEGKDAITEGVKRMVQAEKAFRYAMLSNTHMKYMSTLEEVEAWRESGRRIESLPEAKEVLVLSVGDAESEEIWACDIEFDGRGIRRPGQWKNW